MRRRHAMIAVALMTSLAAAGCQTENAYTGEKQTSNATKGALIGAAGGAAIGALTNKNQRGKNALIGAGIGAAAGGGIGYYMDRQEAELREQLRAAGVSVERRGDTIALNMQNDILFGVGSAQLSSRSGEVLKAVAIVLKKYDETRVNVYGFTDTTGTASRNEELSQRRAQSVADELMHNGVASARLNTQGMGEKNLKVSTADNIAEARNRRVEIVLEPMNG
jgi:outer membrane protein OmpA-like peptidoglycan-associated protein